MHRFAWVLIPLLLGGTLPLGAGAQETEARGTGVQETGVQGTEATVAVEQIEVPPTDPKTAAGRTLSDWYALGGWVMHLLVGCSVLSVALVLERSWSLRRSAVIPGRFLKQLREHWHRREIPQVVGLCEASKSSIARVLRAGLLHFEEGLSQMQDAIEVAGAHEQTLLRRNLPFLAALANIATMLGLLGTVLGMIESFDLIAQTGTGDARVVAGGIFQALVTTAAGLIVGIFTIACHSFFRRKAEVLVIDLEDLSLRLLEDLSREPEAVAAVRPREGDLAPAEA
jgi:biopolymer transport protein ExbB